MTAISEKPEPDAGTVSSQLASGADDANRFVR